MGVATILKILCRYIKCSSDCGGKRRSPASSTEDFDKYLMINDEVIEKKRYKQKKENAPKEDEKLVNSILELSP